MAKPSLQEVQVLAQTGKYHFIPIYCEVYADMVTPIAVLRKLQQVSNHCYLLESAKDNENWGRYTFLGYDPKLEITCKDGIVQIRENGRCKKINQNPKTVVRAILADHKSPKLPNLPPFTGGLVGYFSYDYMQYAEPNLHFTAQDENQFRDMDLMLFDRLIVFDHLQQKMILIAHVQTADIVQSYRKAEQQIAEIRELIAHGMPKPVTAGRLLSDFYPLFSETAYCAMVEKAKQHIIEGDIFQVVLSNRLQAKYEGSLLDTYRVLRTINPSPYMFYFSGDDIEIAGSSPETLVKLQDGILHTFPLAGTRPRGNTKQEDQALAAELLADSKELAEHNMLVDLGRNDLGKISRFGSVQLEKYLSIERFSHVMHLGSTVKGEIRPDKDALDAIDAILPAGTLSGAPKLRACQIIDELEKNKRGIYGGAVGYLDFTGNMDTCIAIRIAYLKNGNVFIRSGAGIVADSDPQKEYRECLQKAAAVKNAILAAQGGLEQ